MSGAGAKTWVKDLQLRQTAFSIEQMAPGGTERTEPGQLHEEDLERAFARVDELLARPAATERGAALREVRHRTERLHDLYRSGAPRPLVYVDRAVFALESRLRSAALEIDFSFGDKNGELSEQDLQQARFHYGQVRGPVGWNRLLLTDEIQRRLFPQRTLRTTDGMKLVPDDWVAEPPNPLARLEKVSRYLDDAALARTYADVAARYACAANAESAALFEKALALLGREIRSRDSIRPTITDIARIGCEDPVVKANLRTPIEMSRKLSPSALLDRFLN